MKNGTGGSKRLRSPTPQMCLASDWIGLDLGMYCSVSQNAWEYSCSTKLHNQLDWTRLLCIRWDLEKSFRSDERQQQAILHDNGQENILISRNSCSQIVLFWALLPQPKDTHATPASVYFVGNKLHRYHHHSWYKCSEHGHRALFIWCR